MRTKFIVTNCKILRKKYKSFNSVKARINALIAADKTRGIETKLFDVSDPATMKKAGGKAVTQAKNPKQNKEAIDAIYTSAAKPPDYLMILGAVDVIPHQDMDNPMFGGDDLDEHAWGDLPYACDAPYSRDAATFKAPTRVVGRLPDIDGASDSSYLRKLLANAASWTPMTADAYRNYFAVTARTWEASTKLSIKKTFGTTKALQVSPAAGPAWSGTQLGALSHFINCHGADGRSEFYGENPAPAAGAPRFPVAHQTTLVRNNIAPGTVAAVECCYGAQLYRPNKNVDPNHGICQEYLHDDAYGFFGSTTIAYGPAEGNGAADIICAQFLKHVLAGSSLGLAALQARQDFIKACTVMDAADLKTLAQFNLLGDPSIHPVMETKAKASAKGVSSKGKAKPKLDTGNVQRREALRKQGLRVAASTPVWRRSTLDGDAALRARQAAENLGIAVSSVKTFTIGARSDGLSAKGMDAAAAAPPRIAIVTGRRAGMEAPQDSGLAAGSPTLSIKKASATKKTPPGFVVAMMKEEADGSMTLYRQLFSK